MKKNFLRIPLRYLIILFLSLSPIACFGRGNIARTVVERQDQLSEYDATALQSISLQELRNANDDKNGTFYYAGLIWYLNNNLQYAEVAWKRAARTGASPWKEEALRLVSYLLVREHKYNQIPVFVQSVTSNTVIRKDPELFSYYSLALWLNKEYETLRTLVAQEPHFTPTLRNRISISQAMFNYDMWKMLLTVMEDSSQLNKLLFTLLTSHSAYSSHSELSIFLTQISRLDTNAISDDNHILLDFHLAILKKNRPEIYTLSLSMGEKAINTPVILSDIYNANRTQSSHKKNAIISHLIKSQSHISKSIYPYYHITLANFYFDRKDYRKSLRFYQGAQDIIISPDSSVHPFRNTIHRVAWRYLYSQLELNIDAFFPKFIEITSNSFYPDYFSDLLEEVLSLLLRKRNTDTLESYYDTYAGLLTSPSQKTVFLRWQNILFHAGSTQKPPPSFLPETEGYTSDLPFDYLINTDDTFSPKKFISDWTVPSYTPLNDTSHIVNDFIPGYLAFGLIQYGFNVALDNIPHIELSPLKNLVIALNEQDEVHKGLSIMRTAASYNKTILQNKEILKLLYPTPFLKTIKTLTSDPIEQMLLLGIIREESSFDKDIVSSAEAIGLMQILLPTAQDIASRITFKKPIDLYNPTTNITLGYHYMSYLIKVLQSPLKAIASYNGGLGNLWKWEDRYPSKNLIVFADSVPFRETRNYIRKVSTSAMIYGILYFDIHPEIFQSFLLSSHP